MFYKKFKYTALALVTAFTFQSHAYANEAKAEPKDMEGHVGEISYIHSYMYYYIKNDARENHDYETMLTLTVSNDKYHTSHKFTLQHGEHKQWDMDWVVPWTPEKGGEYEINACTTVTGLPWASACGHAKIKVRE